MERKLKWIRIDVLVVIIIITLGNLSTFLNITNIPELVKEHGILSVAYSFCFPILTIGLLIYSYITYKTNIIAASSAELIAVIIFFINSTISFIISLIGALSMSKILGFTSISLMPLLLGILPYIIPTILLVDVLRIRKFAKAEEQFSKRESTKSTKAMAVGAIIFVVLIITVLALSYCSLNNTSKVDSSVESNNTTITNELIKIQFKDVNFYDAVKRQIVDLEDFNDSELTLSLYSENINQITSLTFTEFTGSSIKDISGIKHFTKLTKLVLQDSNYLTDISELAYLTNLEYLYLDNNKLLSDLSPISELTKLKKLDLDYSDSMKNIKNINALANLTNLEYLDTSVYNMDYDVETIKNKAINFELPAIFSTAQTNGANIQITSDKTLNVKQFNNNEIQVSASDNGTVTITISGGVYDKITCTVNYIVNGTENS